MTDRAFYDDGLVALDRDGVTIRQYYFPLGASKRIPYARIKGVQARRMGLLSGKGRMWGSGDFRHWLPLDLRRPTKDTLLILDLGRWVKPAITPDNAARVLTILRERGVSTSPYGGSV